MLIRPLFIYAIATALIAGIGCRLSGGLPWGIDDGVKRLMAGGLAQSGGRSVLIAAPSRPDLGADFFPIPPPYVEHTKLGFRGIFPALWPALGSVFRAIFGLFGYSLLPAGSFLLLLWLLASPLKRLDHQLTSTWAVLMVASALWFYGLTFWEHALALIFLIPLCSAVLFRQNAPRGWLLSGLALGGAVYLRPESALLLPCLLFTPITEPRDKLNQLLQLVAGVLMTLLIAGMLEHALTGRWMPNQVPFNLELALGAPGLLQRPVNTFNLIISSPLQPGIFGAGLGLIAVLAIWFRNWFTVAIGLPLLSIIGLLWGFAGKSAFGMTAFSQGLLFAFPWVVITFIGAKGKKRCDDPLFMLGWGTILLSYLLGPDRAGMHWGPRFLFPALLPLIFCSAQVLRQIPARSSNILMTVTGLAALLFASGSTLALAERGQAGREVRAILESAESRVLILDRWHEGADLEPVWGRSVLVWAQSSGDWEELLISLQHHKIRKDIGWLRSEGRHDTTQYPINLVSRTTLPDRAGWRGEFWDVTLADTTDFRWGDIYWHASRRRAEKGMLLEAKGYLDRAIHLLPESADLRYDLAICLGKLRLVDEAAAELQEALRLDPQHEAARELLRRLGIP